MPTVLTDAALPLVLLALASPPQPPADTIRLEVGSPEVDGRIYAPHAARVRIYRGAPDGPLVTEWTNELTLGDSAGRPVMRWVTRSRRPLPNGGTETRELRQTYDARTLAPYGYHSASSTGAYTRLRIDGRRVHGTRRTADDTTVHAVDVTLDRPGFFGGASDLVPLAAGLTPGRVMTAPMWSPASPRAETRVFTVIGVGPVTVEGSRVTAWKVEERRHADGKLLATWYLTRGSPYMVYGEAVQSDGSVNHMSEVAIPFPKP